jgi:hypothetical protein
MSTRGEEPNRDGCGADYRIDATIITVVSIEVHERREGRGATGGGRVVPRSRFVTDRAETLGLRCQIEIVAALK